MKKILNTLGLITLILIVFVSLYMIVLQSYKAKTDYYNLQAQISKTACESVITSAELARENLATVKKAAEFAKEVNTYTELNDNRVNKLKHKVNMSTANIIENMKSQGKRITGSDAKIKALEEYNANSFVPETGLGQSINLKVIKDFLIDTPVEITREEAIERTLNNLASPVGLLDINSMMNGTVYVQGAMGSGSGTVIKKTVDAMYILTCNHVIDANIKFQEAGFNAPIIIGYFKTDITDKIEGNVQYKAEVIKAEEETDLAILKVNIVDPILREVSISLTEPEIGESVVSVGCPLGMFRVVSKGILSNRLEGFYVSDNTTTYGNSGGSLYNLKGELIGVPARVEGYPASKTE